MTKIRICPKCRKPKLKNATNVSGWLAPDMYKCTECDYIGYLYLEVDSEDLKPQNDNEL
ncbi:MAG: hypothetical protein ACFFAK_02105 [Promethearchaeota archaeon]